MILMEYLKDLPVDPSVILADRCGNLIFTCATSGKQHKMLDLYAKTEVVSWKPINDKLLYFELDYYPEE